MRIFGIIERKIDFLRKLNDLFDRGEKLQFLLVIFAALAMAFFQAIGVASILPFVNLVMDPGIISANKWLGYVYESFHFKSQSSFIIFSGFSVLSILILGNIISAFSIWIRINFIWKKNYKLSTALLKKYLSMPYVYFVGQNTSDLGKNVLAEVQQLTSNFILQLIFIITNGIMTVIILGLLIYVNAEMTLLAAAVIIFMYSLIYFGFSAKLKRRGKERILENKGKFKAATEALSGIKDIKVLVVEKFFSQRFAKHSEKFSNLQSWYQLIGQMPRYIVEVFAFGGIVGLLIYSVSTDMSVQKIIPLVSLFAFAGYRLMPAIQEIFNALTTIKFNKAVLDKLHKDMTEDGHLREIQFIDRKKLEPLRFQSQINLEETSFRYPGAAKITLEKITMEIKKNSFVAIIGATGAGKTTLVDLILGLLFPTDGKIKADDMEINEENIKNWQVNLGYVPQQIYLTDDSVVRNIAFGLPDDIIDMNQVERAARMANIHDFVSQELAHGYHTIIGERGIRLSGGQRQRIGIARALYHNPDILIFDEATSSLDSATESEVLSAIENVARTKTMIVISHRLTTVKNCDKVYLIDKGRVVEEGSYQEIFEKKSGKVNQFSIKK